MAITGLNIGTLFVDLEADASDYNKTLDAAEARMARTAESMVISARQILTGFVAAGAGAFGLIDAASDAEEIGSKFSTVFSEISEDAAMVAKDLDDNYGLAADGAQNLLANTADLLSGFGFGQRAALDYSEQVQKLAADLGSFQNVDVTSASQAITKALLGEREAIKQLGISILEKDVLERVALNTTRGLTFETLRQAKAYATLQLAQEQSKNAIGDFARTQGSFANQFKEFKADLRDVAVGLGEALLPTAREVLAELRSGTLDIKGFLQEGKELASLAREGFNLAMTVGKVFLLTKGLRLLQTGGLTVLKVIRDVKTGMAAGATATGSMAGAIRKLNAGFGLGIPIAAAMAVKIFEIKKEFESLREEINKQDAFQTSLDSINQVIQMTAGDAKRAVEALEEIGLTDISFLDARIAEEADRMRAIFEGTKDILGLSGEELAKYNKQVDTYINQQIRAAQATDVYQTALKKANEEAAEAEQQARIAAPINDFTKALLDAEKALDVKDKLALTEKEFGKVKKVIEEMIKAGADTDQAAENIQALFDVGLLEREDPLQKLRDSYRDVVRELKAEQQIPNIQKQLGLNDEAFSNIRGLVIQMVKAGVETDKIVKNMERLDKAGLLKGTNPVEEVVKSFKELNKDLQVTQKALDFKKQ